VCLCRRIQLLRPKPNGLAELLPGPRQVQHDRGQVPYTCNGITDRDLDLLIRVRHSLVQVQHNGGRVHGAPDGVRALPCRHRALRGRRLLHGETLPTADRCTMAISSEDPVCWMAANSDFLVSYPTWNRPHSLLP